jgi:hypothetical protein
MLYYAVWQNNVKLPFKNQLFRRLNVIHHVPLWELSLCVIGLLSIYHCFHFEEVYIMANTAVLCCVAEKHITSMLKTS